MYSMPIVGTSARLYFSNEMCVEPIVTGCVRTNGSSCEQFSDTSNRYFVTESDNHLDMLPGAVNFSRPGLSVNLNDDDGISLKSSSSLYAGAGSIILDAGKVSITAKDKVTIDKNKQSTLSLENECYTDANGVVYENGSCREAFEAFTDDEPTAGVVVAFGVAAKALLAGAVAGINVAFSSLGGESTIIAGEEKKFSTVDKLKSYGYGILGGISKFSTGCRQSMDWVGEHLLDYDRPNGEGGKSYRQISQENDARDEASYNELREKAPCKTAFEDSSNASETTLDLASLAMGVYGVKQLVSSGANYLRMNKSYINANISEAAQNSKILKQAISNVSKNSKGITLGSNGGNAGKYVSDVKGEFDALKNIKNGTKVAGSAKAGGSGSIDDMVKACEGVRETSKGGSGSKLQEVFDTVDNYHLSEDTFNNHILERHGANSTYSNKSHFNADFDIKAGIDSTLKGDNFIVKPNTGDRSGYIFEQTFKDAIGVNSKGKSIYTLKVVIDESGNVITAFPKK